MMQAFADRILAAGPGPAIFGFGVTLLFCLYIARRAGRLGDIRRRPLAYAAGFLIFYTFTMVAAVKPPIDPPAPEPSEVFTARVWIGPDGKIILIDTPLMEIVP